jgi:hypothetical protein
MKTTTEKGKFLMQTITDFDAWIADNQPDDVEDLESLYNATDGESSGRYDATMNDKGQIFISAVGGETKLALLSPAAIQAFKKKVEELNDSGMGIHEAVMFERAMKKDD